ncbi:hydroxymethylglutaryl-CoA synthase [Patescibacteria group bacterium]
MINIKKFTSVSIAGFAGYLPFWRLSPEQIATYWQKDSKKLKNSLGIKAKTVASADEDTLTMAVEASLRAIKQAGISVKKIGAVFVGSESHPYAVKPTGTILAQALGMENEFFCADLQFACKAATTGMQIISCMIEAGVIDYGLVVGADKAQAKPGDALEYTAAAGAAAFILGKAKKSKTKLIATYSIASDTPDFWRRAHCKYPTHTGRFTGEPGYFKHIETCLANFLKKIGKKPEFFDFVVFHMPNPKFPLKVAKKYGFQQKQINPGFLVDKIGNPYSASTLLGLTAVLEQAERNKNVLLVSYGSGSGSDAFWFKTGTISKRKNKTPIKNSALGGEKIDYLTYLQNYQILST